MQINEVNLPYVPRKLLGDVFDYVKVRFLSISFKYSIATQKKYNKDNKLDQNFGINEIKKEFNRLGLKKIDNSKLKIIDIDYKTFPIRYQQRLKQSEPLRLMLICYRKGMPQGYFDDKNMNVGIKINNVYRYFIESGKPKKYLVIQV